MSGPDTPPEPKEPGDEDLPGVLAPETHSVTMVCPECAEYIRIRDVHAYVLANHYAVCREMVLLNGDPD